MGTDSIYDVAVVGAGPAGLAAVVSAADAGLSVLLVDAGNQPGGQYWRHPDETLVPEAGHAGHHGWKTFEDLRSRMYAARDTQAVAYLPDSQVWLISGGKTGKQPFNLQLTPSTDTALLRRGIPESAQARRLILCPGGYDRQLPIPGWDLPGVMAAGGVQALLKGHQTLAGKRAIVAGTGPFLLPVATGLAEAGAKVLAICEAGSPTAWVPHLAAAAGVPSKGIEGAEYAALLAKHRIHYKIRTAVDRIHGSDQVQSVTITQVNAAGEAIKGTEKRLEADLVALGWGFTPSLELPLMLGIATHKDVDGSLIATVDEDMRSSVDGVYIAGEATGVGGALMAVAEGNLAGLSAAEDAGKASQPQRVKKLRKNIARYRKFAVAMHLAHPVPKQWTSWLEPGTTVCRCEEVTYGDLCHIHTELDANDPRSMKMMARPGMGWCQGRVCGYATASITAGLCERETNADDLLGQARRPLAAPVSLAQLAALDEPTNHQS